jgi:hypothetical protein
LLIPRRAAKGLGLVVKSDWPIVIGGSHRSGTTLLRRLLDGHPRIFCPPEIKFHKDLLAQFPNDPLAHGRLGSSMRSLGLPTEMWLDEFGQALCRCYVLAAQQAGKARWADKNPENVVNIAHWDRLLRGRMAFILVVRHPLDVIASMDETPMHKVIPADIFGRARHVLEYAGSGLAFFETHPERSLIVRYERLVAEPRLVLRELTSFLSEEYSEAMIDNLQADHGQGLEDPKSRSFAGISNENAGRWRRDLSAEQLTVAKPLVAAIAQRLAYDL